MSITVLSISNPVYPIEGDANIVDVELLTAERGLIPYTLDLSRDDGTLHYAAVKKYVLNSVISPTPPKSVEELTAEAKGKRDGLLQEVLWRVERHNTQVALGDTPTDSAATMLTIYRYLQDLRDVTTQPDFPYNVNWPTLLV